MYNSRRKGGVVLVLVLRRVEAQGQSCPTFLPLPTRTSYTSSIFASVVRSYLALRRGAQGGRNLPDSDDILQCALSHGTALDFVEL